MNDFQKYEDRGGSDTAKLGKNDNYLPAGVQDEIEYLKLGTDKLTWGDDPGQMTLDDYQGKLAANLGDVLENLDAQDYFASNAPSSDAMFGLFNGEEQDWSTYMKSLNNWLDATDGPFYLKNNKYVATEALEGFIDSMGGGTEIQRTNLVNYVEDLVNTMKYLDTFGKQNSSISSLEKRLAAANR